jgi:carbamoyl-phosphate synthase large subunit
MKKLTVAITGLNATDNPAPGVPVIRAIRAGAGDACRIVGLSYDPLDPGNYMTDIADRVYLVPYPSQGAEALFERLAEIHDETPIDVLVPTLDAELESFIKLGDFVRELSIKLLLPSREQLRMRSKARFHMLADMGIRVPKSVAMGDSSAIRRLDEEFDFPVMVKGQFYGAEIAYSPMEVEAHFQRFRSQWGVPVIVQEFLSGEEYDVAAVGDGEGGLVGAVPMRKMQLTEKGKAWGGITVDDPGLTSFVTSAVRALRWRGPCELEVLRASADGQYYMLEINPRFPAWIYLSVGAGRNLPWAAVRLAAGEAVEQMPPPAPGVMFLRHSFDQICLLEDYERLTTTGMLEPAGGAR